MADLEQLLAQFQALGQRRLDDRRLEPLDNMPNFPRDVPSTGAMELATRRPFMRPQVGPLSDELGISSIKKPRVDSLLEMLMSKKRIGE